MALEADRNTAVFVLSTACYRTLLRLYPHTFWRTYAEELEDDFVEHSRDAWTTRGWTGLALWWGRAAGDLIVSLPVEWLRTPWIPVLAIAAIVSSLVFTDVWVRGKRAFAFLSPYRADDSPQLLFLMLLMVLIPVVCTVLIWWVVRLANLASARRRRRV